MHDKEYYTKTYNKLSANFGVEVSSVYGILLGINDYLKGYERLTEDGYFYVTIPTLQELTRLQRKRQSAILKEMVAIGLIDIKRRGNPARRYFKILSYDMGQLQGRSLDDFQIVQNGQTRLSQMDKLDCPKSANKIVPNGQTSLSQTDTKLEYINKNKETRTYIRTYKNKDNEEIINLYEESFGGIHPKFLEMLNDDIQAYGKEWVFHALKRTIKRNIKQWKYVTAILNDWRKYGMDSKPWEIEENGSNRKDSKKSSNMYGNATAEQWENEPTELIL